MIIPLSPCSGQSRPPSTAVPVAAWPDQLPKTSSCSCWNVTSGRQLQASFPTLTCRDSHWTEFTRVQVNPCSVHRAHHPVSLFSLLSHTLDHQNLPFRTRVQTKQAKLGSMVERLRVYEVTRVLHNVSADGVDGFTTDHDLHWYTLSRLMAGDKICWDCRVQNRGWDNECSCSEQQRFPRCSTPQDDRILKSAFQRLETAIENVLGLLERGLSRKSGVCCVLPSQLEATLTEHYIATDIMSIY